MRLIDADELKKKFAYITHVRFTADMGQGGFEMFSEKEIEDIIDKALTIKTYCYFCGQTEHGQIEERGEE